jgi:hypothetical protein
MLNGSLNKSVTNLNIKRYELRQIVLNSSGKFVPINYLTVFYNHAVGPYQSTAVEEVVMQLSLLRFDRSDSANPSEKTGPLHCVNPTEALHALSRALAAATFW